MGLLCSKWIVQREFLRIKELNSSLPFWLMCYFVKDMCVTVAFEENFTVGKPYLSDYHSFLAYTMT